MKKFLYLLILSLFTVACENNGPIGWVYGVWRFDSVTVDGAPRAPESYNTSTMSFQGPVVAVVRVLDEYQTASTCYGQWSESGDILTISYKNHDDATAEGTGDYFAPEWLGFISTEPMEMHVSDRTSRDATLTWKAPDGKNWVYKIHKTVL